VQGITHGGMLATVADGALAINVSLARGRRAAQVTVWLTVDYLSGAARRRLARGARQGDSPGKQLAYASCDLMVGDRQVLRSSAVFALRDKPLPGAPAEGTLQDG
jgi:acyl-coenzyme A thioesterase PaaI-like protein